MSVRSGQFADGSDLFERNGIERVTEHLLLIVSAVGIQPKDTQAAGHIDFVQTGQKVFKGKLLTD